MLPYLLQLFTYFKLVLHNLNTVTLLNKKKYRVGNSDSSQSLSKMSKLNFFCIFLTVSPLFPFLIKILCYCMYCRVKPQLLFQYVQECNMLLRYLLMRVPPHMNLSSETFLMMSGLMGSAGTFTSSILPRRAAEG